MPLPWLIGAAVVAAGAAIVNALSDDDKPSNNDDDERRRRRAAEREREERERNERKNAIKQEFDHYVEQVYQEIKNSLPNFVRVDGIELNNLTLSNNGSNLSELESTTKELSQTIKIGGLGSVLSSVLGYSKAMDNVILYTKDVALKYQFIKDISLFEKIYSIDVEWNEKMQDRVEEIYLLKDELKQLTLAIEKLS